ncbi:O-antigen ligase family protein [Sphingomonas sp. LB-2]|uniref:O-antigen ligase family protein n=1 Tax=Sphingomonas caeni TaxID=2984949 RepID=UPI00222F3797|nr:O-antigen ligase family protein [Sphingomonas caeni]MCW3849344.1 O-antigen ligase family protein [Sphingomonas caeni]
MSNKLFPTLLGLDQAVQRSPRMPPRFLAVLVLTLIAFYLANAFSSPLTALLIQAKWVPLILLLMTSAYILAARPSPTLPVAVMLPMSALFVVGVMTIWSSVDRGFSLLSLITVGGTILVGYVVSALVVATDSRRAYFELLATFGRVMIVITVLFVLAGLNLGRGAGLTAWTDNPNTLGMILAPSLVIFLAGCIERRPGWVVWHAAFFIVGFFLVWATNSRAAVIWIGLSMGAFWMYRRGPGFTVLLAMVGLIILIGWWYPIKIYMIQTLGLNWSIRDVGISPLSGREEVWRIGWDLFQKRPVTGYGLGTSQDLIRAEAYKFVRHQGLHFHSSYIMAMVELGIFGLISLLTAIGFTLIRAIAHSGRARVLPRESWPLAALPFALVVGALGHAVFESWLLAAGNANMLLFWTWVWMIHHQTQVKIRAVIRREVPPMPYPAGAALPAR